MTTLPDITNKQILSPERQKDELYEVYQTRRHLVEQSLKKYLRGTLLWESCRINKGTDSEGKEFEYITKHTYIKSRDGEL